MQSQNLREESEMRETELGDARAGSDLEDAQRSSHLLSHVLDSVVVEVLAAHKADLRKTRQASY